VSFVRVRLPNGHETSINGDFARSEGLEILDAPATNLRGKPLPATRKNGRPKKKRTSVAQAAAKKAAAVPSEATAGGDAEGGIPE
jgi:hypothetical protein